MSEQSADANYQGVWGNRIGFGKKAALLMIDFMQGYTTKGAPLFAPGVVTAPALLMVRPVVPPLASATASWPPSTR